MIPKASHSTLENQYTVNPLSPVNMSPKFPTQTFVPHKKLQKV